ncbi:hypothetical protein AB5I41_24530 [Sphingomonas sp. MMS24-JH45]
MLLQNPVFGTPAISRTNSNFSTLVDAGVATVDLRNLGRTARWCWSMAAASSRASRYLDGRPQHHPGAVHERVDVLTGGSAAVYGSDAVAGVVNIIYKKNFSGVELNGQSGVSEVGDDSQRQLNLTLGSNSPTIAATSSSMPATRVKARSIRATASVRRSTRSAPAAA